MPNTRKSLTTLVLFFIIMQFQAAPADAQTSEDLVALIEAQNQKIEELTKRLETLENVPQTNARQPADAEKLRPARELPAEDITHIEWRGSPELINADHGWSIKPNSRIQADLWNSHSNTAADYQSGSEMRRVVLGIQGKLSPKISYVANIDFAHQDLVYEDVYLQYRPRPGLALNFGHHEASVSFEDETSDSNMAFMERSPYNAMTPGRSVGFSSFAWGEHWSLKAGIFGEPEQSNPVAAIDEGWRAALRGGWVPIRAEGQLLHLGASVYHIDLRGENKTFRVKAFPESQLISMLVDTGSHVAEDISFTGIELAAVAGAFSFQTEWGKQRVNYAQLQDADYTSGYAQVGWFATGEYRPYDIVKGKFTRVTPRVTFTDGGPGAIELAIRYSQIDLNDAAIAGGSQDIWTVALNWYINANIRTSLNWAFFDVTGSAATQPFGLTDHRGNTIGLRTQMTW